MKKRGQVTIFIILAVLIVAMGVLFFIFKEDIGLGSTPSEVAPINAIIISCLESTAKEGINYISLRGGYYNIPDEFLREYYTDKFSYYYINSRKYIPTLERVNRELENYILDNFKECTNFSFFESQGFKISEGELVVSSDIKENEVVIEVVYPLVISKGESSSRLKDFDTKISSKAYDLYGASAEVLESYSLNPGMVCLSCLEDVSEKYNLNVKAVPVIDGFSENNNAIFFSVSDKQNELNWKFVVEQ